jgi:hypothetical protein
MMETLAAFSTTESGMAENHLSTNQTSAAITLFTMAGFFVGLEVGEPPCGDTDLTT